MNPEEGFPQNIKAYLDKLVEDRFNEQRSKRKRGDDESIPDDNEEEGFDPPTMNEVKEALNAYKEQKGVNGMYEDFVHVGKTTKFLKKDLWLQL